MRKHIEDKLTKGPLDVPREVVGEILDSLSPFETAFMGKKIS